MRDPAAVLICAALALSLSAGGCTVVGDKRVDGWPQLEVVEHKVSADEMQLRCGAYVAPGMTPVACAQFDFGAARCDIWYGGYWLLRPLALAHERSHCLGYEHAGQQRMEKALKEYRAAAGGT